MASEANTGQHIPQLFEALYTEISRMGLPVAIAFDVAGEEALAVTLDVDAGHGAPPQGFALVADGTVGSTPELLKGAFFDPQSISVGEGATNLSDEAALIVVDPSPTESRRPEYDGVGAVVLSDARFAAREIANRAVAAGRELGFVPAAEATTEAAEAPAPDTAEADVPTSQTAESGTSEARAETDEGAESSRDDHYQEVDVYEAAHAAADSSEAGSSEAGSSGADDLEDRAGTSHGADPDNQATAGTGALADSGEQQMDYGASSQDSTEDSQEERHPQAAGSEHLLEQTASDAARDTAPHTADSEEHGPDVTEPSPKPEKEPQDTDLPDTDLAAADRESGDDRRLEPDGPRDGESTSTTDGDGPQSAGTQSPQTGAVPSGAAPADEAERTASPPTPAEGNATEPTAEDTGSADADDAAQRLNGLYDEEVFGPLSDYVQRLHHIRDALEADAEDGRALTPEREQALEALQAMGRGRGFYRRLRAKFNRPPDELDRIVADAAEPNWSPITVEDAEGFIRNPYPGVLLMGNNKGGVGKTAVAVEAATSIATTGVPEHHERGIKVLLVEQNYANPDIRKRVQLPPGRPPGMIEYIEAMRAAEAAGGELPDLSEYVSHVQGLKTDNLYVLPIAADEGEWRHNGKVTTYDLDGVYEAAADAGFDLIVVDLQNGLPQAGNLTAETIGFWVSVADVMYLVLGPSEAVQNGSEFLDGARALVEFYGHSCSLVPVFNQWRPGRNTNKRWSRGVAALGADTAIAPAHFIPSEFAEEYEDGGLYGGSGAYFHRIPSHPAAADFCLEKRRISLESRRFKEPFYLLALDALTRIKRNRASYFEPSSGDSSGNGGLNEADGAGDGPGPSDSQGSSENGEEV